MISKILNDAANYIESHGWIKGQYEKYPEGPCCVMGALYRVMNVDVGECLSSSLDLQYVVDYLDKYLELYNIAEFHGIVSFNDDLDTTKSEVITFLRDAANDWKDE